MSKYLIAQRRFGPYFGTQFLGAFNDNIYRNAFAILVTYFLAKENQAAILSVALVAFIIPYFLFGAIAGQLADKYEKSALIQKIKIAEIVIMLVGCITLYFQHVPSMLGVLFALGTQSAFFGPIKYSILPQHLPKNQILDANAYVESGTFIAILLGGILGGYLASDIALLNWLMAAIVGFAVLGWLSSRAIPSAPAAAPDLTLSFNIVASSLDIIRQARKNPPVFKSILANSWFWFVSAFIATHLPIYAESVLSGDANVAILVSATTAIGIGLGSFACSVFSRGRVEIGLVPYGIFGMTVCIWLLSDMQFPPVAELRTVAQVMELPSMWSVLFLLVMNSFFSGLFIVPLYAFIQTRSDQRQTSRMIAVNNIFNAAFMVGAGVMGIVLSQNFSVLEVFKIAAILNLIVGLIILNQVSAHFLRLLSWLLIRCAYRIKGQDLHHIPEEGAALVVCNHASFADPMVLLAELPRPARFVMHYDFYELPIAGSVFRGLNSIPIGTQRDRPELIDSAFDQIADALQAGQLVVVFPEGGITRNGEMNKFQPGIEQIIKRTPVPVIPVAIRGMWGTWWSRKAGKAMSGLPKGFMKKLTVVAGGPVEPGKASRLIMHEKVNELRGPLSEQ